MDSVSSGAFALQILYLILILAVSAACLFVSWTCVSTITLVSNGFSLLDPEAPAGVRAKKWFLAAILLLSLVQFFTILVEFTLFVIVEMKLWRSVTMYSFLSVCGTDRMDTLSRCLYLFRTVIPRAGLIVLWSSLPAYISPLYHALHHSGPKYRLEYVGLTFNCAFFARSLWFSLNALLVSVTLWLSIVPNESPTETGSSPGSLFRPITGAQVVVSVASLQLTQTVVILVSLISYSLLLGRHFRVFMPQSPSTNLAYATNGSASSSLFFPERDLQSSNNSSSAMSMVGYLNSSSLAGSASATTQSQTFQRQQKVVWRFISLSAIVGCAVICEAVSCCVDLARSQASYIRRFCSTGGPVDDEATSRLFYSQAAQDFLLIQLCGAVCCYCIISLLSNTLSFPSLITLADVVSWVQNKFNSLWTSFRSNYYGGVSSNSNSNSNSDGIGNNFRGPPSDFSKGISSRLSSMETIINGIQPGLSTSSSQYYQAVIDEEII
eukprot:gene30796-40095_t